LFSPPRWLRNAHAQSILPSLPGRKLLIARSVRPVVAASRELLLDCGDGVTLQAFHSPASPTVGAGAVNGASGPPDTNPPARVVMLHGWEGSADSLYILTLAQALHERGCDVIRLNLRDHGATHHLNREIFHSCRLPDVIGAVRALQACFPGEPLHLVGFSLGGNFMLRVAADAAKEQLQIGEVVAISPVIDPERTLHALENGFRLYHEYFVQKWTRSLRRKQAAWPKVYDFGPLVRSRNLRRMTDDLVRAFTQFPSLDDYLQGYSLTGNRLAGIDSRTTIVTALDDPIIPAADLKRIAAPSSLNVITTEHGGHCGFVERLSRPSWVNGIVTAAIDQARSSSDRQRL
jgi:predicted alpha/beta-fold hydrolase